MVNPKIVENYRGDSKARAYIKSFRTLNGQEPRDDRVRKYLESRACSITHSCDFIFVNYEMVQKE